jgi:hypothetical protein
MFSRFVIILYLIYAKILEAEGIKGVSNGM